MSHKELYPCGACVMRYGVDDINSINDCCFNTCSQFVDGDQQAIINSPCGQQCVKCIKNSASCKGKNNCQFRLGAPVIRIRPQQFKQCLMETGDKDQALECCFKKCGNFDEQESCLDAYNALQKSTYESFLPPYSKDNTLIYIALAIGAGVLTYNCLKKNKRY